MTSNRVRSSQTLDDSILRLNVGGKRYEAYASTFTSKPNTLLGTMFAERNISLNRTNHEGEYFFDRNGDVFGIILDWYRTGFVFDIPSHIPKGLIENELDFFQIPYTLDELLCPSSKQDKAGDRIREMAQERVLNQLGDSIDQLYKAIVEHLELAASKGCRACVLDFPRTPGYLRQSSSLSTHPNQGGSNAPVFRHNIIKPEFEAVLSNHLGRQALMRRLEEENFTYSSKQFAKRCWSFAFTFWGPEVNTDVS
eukprot:Colp12_sorted_trinity150504_noHs@3788